MENLKNSKYENMKFFQHFLVKIDEKAFANLKNLSLLSLWGKELPVELFNTLKLL
jgi:hypothetical protein